MFFLCNFNFWWYFRYADDVSVADEVLVSKNNGDELTQAKVINVATSVKEGKAILSVA